ncbi:LacI family DNA-binding transcriptional regulator [Sinorhizobium alkalisoli]|uniref:LacI family transcriptional regulator n=1 Tax=Sinorhizobium alkalisoli TaxID=1752398 RepID=A0A1E3V6K3_9HYPH|nr:LacI family DNA-binding transcriptional regulator [Sinorhizobium alkalisoli]MCA1493738.1 LacI family DNA-binding transcriptional regulator [Ensifer sp. NBAIM29]MCG5477990.1 LacI family transcriptional regulator [Sinorhizobium alkalisoli]ODR89159.1 LacI family transcriptional regulator [Sinorhizobium alkalisoli]
MRRMPTVKDVAEQAGVSVGTVSRVLAGEAAVKPALREKVTDAIAALGYRPNVTARALRTSKTDVIGLIVPDITNPFFAQMAASIESAAMQRKHTVMLASSHNDPEAERHHISAFLDRSVCGIIVAASSQGPHLPGDLPIPIISLDRRFADFPLVSTNHAQAASLMADHLYGLGHRRIAYIAGPPDTEVGRLRQQGFVDRLRRLGETGEAVDLTIYPGKFDYESGEMIAREVLSLAPDKRPTAIAAASDQQAIGALRAASDLKIDVPRELSIAGFDDISLAKLVVPRLTTVCQPVEKLAMRAVALLFGGSFTAKDEMIDGSLIARGSTAPRCD